MNTNKSRNLYTNLGWSMLIVVIMLGLSTYAWQQLPADAQIPVHWNAYGQPDRFGGKFEGLMLLPLITGGLAILLAVVPYIEPRRQNLLRSFKAYSALWITVIGFMGLIHTIVVLNILGYDVNFARVMPASLSVLFIILGNYLSKVRSTFMFGIRTPWTLSSELSWNKTHRRGGKLFVILGLFFLVGSFLLDQIVWGSLFGIAVLGLVVYLFVYSYLVWKEDGSPERPTAGEESA